MACSASIENVEVVLGDKAEKWLNPEQKPKANLPVSDLEKSLASAIEQSGNELIQLVQQPTTDLVAA
jgi:hypothetical protein